MTRAADLTAFAQNVNTSGNLANANISSELRRLPISTSMSTREWSANIPFTTAATPLFTVDINSANNACWYEVYIAGGDWSNHSAMRMFSRGVFCPNGSYTPWVEYQKLTPNSTITTSYVQSGNSFTYRLALDSQSVTGLCLIKLVGLISSVTKFGTVD
jgi:hypothetical protein